VFGRWNLRVAVAASLVSKNRFGTCPTAAKTISDRIVFSPGIEDSTLLFNILPSLGAFALPELPENDRSLKVIERMSFPLKGDRTWLCQAFGLSVEISTETGNLRRQTRPGSTRQRLPDCSVDFDPRLSQDVSSSTAI
jgi:hypothetical protein